jgi:hypothetical protein
VQVTWPWFDAPAPAVRGPVDAGVLVIEQGKE